MHNISWNRLEMPVKTTEFRQAFTRLRELQLNATLMAWDNVRLLASYIPSLQVLETGYNQLRHLLTTRNHASDGRGYVSELKVINFDSNELTDWAATCQALSPFNKSVCTKLVSTSDS